MNGVQCRILNPTGDRRVSVTKELPGEVWLERLATAGGRAEVCRATAILEKYELTEAIGASGDADIAPLLSEAPPQAAPRIVRAGELDLSTVGSQGQSGGSRPVRRSQ